MENAMLCIPPKSTSARRHHCIHQQGGSKTDIVFVLLVLGLMGYGLFWIMKNFGRAGGQYTTAVLDTRDSALGLQCQMNMRSIGQSLQTYLISNGTYPPSMQELKQCCGGDSRLFRCQDPNGGEYIYIPPKRADTPDNTIILYEPNAVHDGQCSVLLANGQVGLLTADQITALLSQTRGKRR